MDVYRDFNQISVTNTHTLTLYHTIPTFNNPEKRKLLNTFWEKEKMLVTFILSSANANLGQPKNLSSGKGFTHYHAILTFNDSKHCGKRKTGC